MLNFPPYQTHSIILLLMIFIGLAAISFSIYEWRKSDSSDHFLKFLLPLLAGALFFFVGGFFSIYTLLESRNFRNIPISNVVGMEITKMKTEYKSENFKIFFKNKKTVQNGLKMLQDCSELYRNHESFEDGYKFKLIFQKPPSKDYFISAYRQNNVQNKSRHSVMPHIEEKKNLNLGDYQCPSCQIWIKENIDPLFENK